MPLTQRWRKREKVVLGGFTVADDDYPESFTVPAVGGGKKGGRGGGKDSRRAVETAGAGRHAPRHSRARGEAKRRKKKKKVGPQGKETWSSRGSRLHWTKAAPSKDCQLIIGFNKKGEGEGKNLGRGGKGGGS